MPFPFHSEKRFEKQIGLYFNLAQAELMFLFMALFVTFSDRFPREILVKSGNLLRNMVCDFIR
jgi:hypothetical protein